MDQTEMQELSEKMAEFAGAKIQENGRIYVYGLPNKTPKEWLHSAIGQEALMDKLEQNYSVYWSKKTGQISLNPYDRMQIDIVDNRNKIRQGALIQAAYEAAMLEGRE